MSLTGWGRGSWNEGAWNESVPLAVTQSALTSSLGSVTVLPSIEVSVTQSALTSALGTTSFVGSVSVAVTQSSMTSSVGSESVTADSNVTASTNVGTGSIGNVQTPIFSIGVFPVGLSATGSTGEENVWSLIDTSQTPNFSSVVTSQTPNWNKIAHKDKKMASTFVNNLRLEEIATGEQSGQWGTKTNTNLELVGEALGFGTEAITTNADTHATTVADATSDAGRAIYIIYTGTLDSACTITIGPDTLKRVHIIKNGTSGSQNILIKQGSGGGAAVTIPNGDTKVVSLDGGGSGAIVTDVFASLSAVDLKVQDDLTLSSDSAVVTFGADGDTTLTHTDGTGLTLNSTNKLTFGDAASFIHQSADGVLTVDGEATIDLNASTAVLVSHDLKLNSDGAILGFGVDNEVTLTHVHNAGLILGGTAPSLTIGDAGAEDTKLVFDGNAQDFYVGLDDSADDLVIGKGSAVGTTPALSIDENLLVTVSDDVFVTGRASGTATTNTNGQMDLAVSNHFNYTPSGDDEIELDNLKGGQTGTIFLDNSGGHTLSVDSTIAINADVLSAISTAGKYMLSYYCTIDQANATLSNSANNDLILMSATGALT